MQLPKLYFTKSKNFKPQLNKARIELVGAPFSRAPLKILFIADVHADENLCGDKLKAIAQIIKSTPHDLMVLGGDIGEGKAYINEFLGLLKDHNPPLGKFSAMGNNDIEAFGKNVFAVKRAFAAAGITILCDDAAQLNFNGKKINIIGVNYPFKLKDVPIDTDDCGFNCDDGCGASYANSVVNGSASGSDLNNASHADDIEPAPASPAPQFLNDGSVNILLSHAPAKVVFDSFEVKPHLMLCGHTHGGQFSLFGLNPYHVGYEHSLHLFCVAGLKTFGDTKVFTSNGIGTSKLPFRLGVAPQIDLLEIT